MTAQRITPETLQRWRADLIAFITEALIDPETGRPFILFEAERVFLQHAFKIGDDGRLLYPEQVFSAPKKTGKTGLAALHQLTTTLLFGGRHADSFCVANDLEQASSRVFEQIRRIVEASSLLQRDARITANKIMFPAIRATITALASEYAGAAGAAPTCSCFDELFAYTSERSRRMFDEMVPTPTRRISCRLTVTTAGWSGESQLLEELYHRGLALPQVGPDLHAGDGLLMYWTHRPQAPWQTEAWLASMRKSLRPNQFRRMILNEFVASESSFIDVALFDQCVDPNYRPVLADRALPVWVGVDASVKHDSTALVAVAYDRAQQKVRLVTHRIIQPDPQHPVDFATAVEATILNWARAFRVKAVLYDPHQMAASSQRLSRDGVKMVEFPQTLDRLTPAAENLFELIRGRNLLAYPDEQIRTAITRTVAVESSRGWRLGKEKQSHKIDVVVALMMASLAAVREQRRRDIRAFRTTGADGFGQLEEYDPRTGDAIAAGDRMRVVRNADGSIGLRGGDNGCHPTNQPRRSGGGAVGLY